MLDRTCMHILNNGVCNFEIGDHQKTNRLWVALVGEAFSNEVDNLLVAHHIPDAVAGQHKELVVRRQLVRDDIRES